MKKILLIDDDKSFAESLKIFLGEVKYHYLESSSGLAGLEMLAREHPDLVISDFCLPDLNGIQILKKAKAINQDIQIIIVTAYDDIGTTISAIQHGAFDCIDKLTELTRLNNAVQSALERKRSENLFIPVNFEREEDARNILIGKHPSMKEIYRMIGNVSSNRVTVLIQGESGTGKELVARTIHNSGITKGHPFIAVNCAALSESLLESELFGHVKGAFTGAIRDKKGKFELAGEGTIFLAEISEISPCLQVKLLRVLQEKEFERVGGESTIPVRARIIAASNMDLKKLVAIGRFRADLYYRLKVFTIDVPPLRYRREDIPRLVVYFMNRINKELKKNVVKIPYDLMDYLQSCQWTGNVRELENTLTQAIVLAKGDVLEKEYLHVTESRAAVCKTDECILSLAEMEKKYIINVLCNSNWNKQKACRVLKVSKTTLYSKIKSYQIEDTPVIPSQS